MITRKVLSTENIENCKKMLADIAPKYFKHLTINPETAVNTSAANPSEINTHQLVFEVLIEKLIKAGIPFTLEWGSDVNGTCYKIWRIWKDWKNKQ